MRNISNLSQNERKMIHQAIDQLSIMLLCSENKEQKEEIFDAIVKASQMISDEFEVN